MLDLIAHVLVFGSLTCGLLFLEDWLTANNPHRSFWYGRLRENIIKGIRAGPTDWFAA